MRLIREENPTGLRLVHDALRGRRVCVWVGEEGWTVSGGDEIEIGDPDDVGVVVASDPSTIAEVLAGSLSLAQAVRADRVRVVGPLAELDRLREAFVVWLHAVIRCGGAHRLLRELTALLPPVRPTR